LHFSSEKLISLSIFLICMGKTQKAKAEFNVNESDISYKLQCVKKIEFVKKFLSA